MPDKSELGLLETVAATEGSGATKTDALAATTASDPALDETVLPTKRTSSPALDVTMASSPGLAATVTSQVGTQPAGERTRLLPVGKQLGRYTLEDRLGAGAMGVVYRAQDRELGRHVAIKVLHRPDEALTERLVREARSMAQVSHPNVVAVYDVGERDGTTYIAMELVSGDSLRSWQDGHTVEKIVEAYISAGKGLAAAHAAGIVHRDFKPDNVLVGKDGRTRVTDFGLAAVDDKPQVDIAARSIEDINLTTSGSVLGTPAYMAPEQFESGNVDARTDQFNFCVALYEALYGERPFQGRTFEELSENVRAGKVRPSKKSEVSSKLRGIILRGMSTRPGDRYPTMDHLLADLGRDRARPLRRASQVLSVLAGMLAIALGSDWTLRRQAEARLAQSFELTATQTDRAIAQLVASFDANSNQAYNLPYMRDVSAQYDQSDFGLGEEIDDTKKLAELHEVGTSVDWQFARNINGVKSPAIIAVGDYKARLLYSSASGNDFGTDLGDVAGVRGALAGKNNGRMLALARYDDAKIVATKLLGPTPPAGLALVFVRSLVLQGSPRSVFVQLLPASTLPALIRLDRTPIAVVGPDGTIDGAIARETLEHPPEEVRIKRIPLTGTGNEKIGEIALMGRVDGTLSLFPNARMVLLAAMFVALVGAFVTRRLAKQVADARAG